jgi:hypothetical protein
MRGNVYRDLYTVGELTDDDFYLVTAQNGVGSASESLVPRWFLEAYEVGLRDAFACDVDSHGRIVLETIKRMQ